MPKKILLIVLMFVTASSAFAQNKKIKASQAIYHVGETAMVCAIVAEITSGRDVHYINLDNRYPKQTLSIVIWPDTYSAFTERFGALENLQAQNICVRGKITEYKSTLQIILSNPQYLRLMQ